MKKGINLSRLGRNINHTIEGLGEKLTGVTAREFASDARRARGLITDANITDAMRGNKSRTRYAPKIVPPWADSSARSERRIYNQSAREQQRARANDTEYFTPREFKTIVTSTPASKLKQLLSYMGIQTSRLPSDKEFLANAAIKANMSAARLGNSTFSYYKPRKTAPWQDRLAYHRRDMKQIRAELAQDALDTQRYRSRPGSNNIENIDLVPEFRPSYQTIAMGDTSTIPFGANPMDWGRKGALRGLTNVRQNNVRAGRAAIGAGLAGAGLVGGGIAAGLTNKSALGKSSKVNKRFSGPKPNKYF